MAPLIVAPYVDTYTARTPYLTAVEYQNAPTAVDTSQLIPGGTGAANLAELGNVIARASSWADQLCYQVLAATTSVETASRVMVRRDGTVRVACKYWPILEVDAFTAGRTPSTMAAVSDVSNLWVDGQSVIVAPVAGLGNTTPYPAFAAAGALWPGDRAYCQWTYVNGWPNTLLAAAAVAGATTVTVESALGVYPGTMLTVYDGANTEQITVASNGVNGTTLTLTAGLQFAHTAQVSVSALPPAVKQAVISLTSALIKTRGAESLVMPSVGAEPSRVAELEGGGLADLEIAVDLLARFRRVA